MKKKILLTRPRAASEKWAQILAQHGFASVIEPLLTIEPTPAPRPAGEFQAVLITSAQAPDILELLHEDISGLLSLPCFCVGTATGASARAIGFTDTRCGSADSADLAQQIVATLKDKTRPILHIAGEIVDGKARQILAENGFTLTSWIVYRANAVEDLTPETREAFKRGDFFAVPVFSSRSARILVSVLEKNKLVRACHPVLAIGLSQTVADVLQTLPWQGLRVAAKPEEDEVLACLKAEISMTPTENTSLSSEPTPRACGRRKIRWACRLLTAALLIGFGAAGVLYCPLATPFLPPPTKPPERGALEQRVALLETRLNAPHEQAPTIAPPATSEPSALTETVKNLETRLAQVENKNGQERQATQKLIAAAFAFWDLRQTIQEGRAFAPQREALLAASSGDAVAAEELAKLAPYAATATPVLPRLREALTAAEAEIPAPVVTQDAAASWWARIRAALQPLVAVRSLHEPRFAALENALDSGDASAALDAVQALPDETRQGLTAWQAKLEARMAIDDALKTLSAHFTAPPTQGSVP